MEHRLLPANYLTVFIPFFTKSLIGDGLSGFATGISGASGAVVSKAGKGFAKRSPNF